MKILIVGGVGPTRRKCIIAARNLNLDVVLAFDGRDVPWASPSEAPQMAACIVRSTNENSKDAEMIVRARFPLVPVLTLFENDTPYSARDPESTSLILMGPARDSLASIKRKLSETLIVARRVGVNEVCGKGEGHLQE